MSAASDDPTEALVRDIVDRAWRLPSPTALHAPPSGTNNLTRLIEVDDRRFVLRLSRTLSHDQAEAEARLRAQLRTTALDVAVPEPVPTVDGKLAFDGGDDGIATLSVFLAGARPELTGPQALHAFGDIAGRLVTTLATLPDHFLVHDWSTGPLGLLGSETVGDLAGDLTRAGAPAEAVAALLAGATDQLTKGAEVAALPRQLIHGDLAASNLLADGDLADGSGRVCAVLDFEVAGLDVRVNELVTAMAQSPALDAPALTRAVVAGFTARVDLSEAERRAVPDLLVSRGVGSVLWRARAWRRGDASLDDVARRLRGLTDTVAFVRDHRSDLDSILLSGGTG